MLNFKDILRPIPLEVVDMLFFGNAVLVEEVINVFKPVYSGYLDETGIEEFHEEQKDFFQNILPKAMREIDAQDKSDENYTDRLAKKETFIIKFVKYCTGSDFLPDPVTNPQFKIDVAFTVKEMTHEELPMSHSCVNMLKLPARVYDGDIDTFKSKLKIAVESSYDSFGMR